MLQLSHYERKRSKIGDFSLTRSLWSKISGRRGRPPPIIFYENRPFCVFARCYGWGAYERISV